MKLLNLLVLAAACAGVSAAAIAQTAPTTTPAASPATPAAAGRHGMRIDANGDGVVSRQEAASFPRMAEKFDQIDADKDGKLSNSELQAWRGQMRQGRGHGDRVADPERQARMAERRNACFDKADTDHNGQLSREEFSKLREACGPMQMRAGGARHRQGNNRPGQVAPQG